jgi:hypothetical protein
VQHAVGVADQKQVADGCCHGVPDAPKPSHGRDRVNGWGSTPARTADPPDGTIKGSSDRGNAFRKP